MTQVLAACVCVFLGALSASWTVIYSLFVILPSQCDPMTCTWSVYHRVRQRSLHKHMHTHIHCSRNLIHPLYFHDISFHRPEHHVATFPSRSLNSVSSVTRMQPVRWLNKQKHALCVLRAQTPQCMFVCVSACHAAFACAHPKCCNLQEVLLSCS